MARSDLRCFRLQRNRWRVSCDMRRERRPPCRLMYATVAVLSVRTSTCSPRKRLLRRFKARCTASNSRQLICQCSWGPVQTPDTASPLNVAPQPLAEADRRTGGGSSCPPRQEVLDRLSLLLCSRELLGQVTGCVAEEASLGYRNLEEPTLSASLCQPDTARGGAPGPQVWTSHDPETVP